jgi:hypothetical protein
MDRQMAPLLKTSHCSCAAANLLLCTAAATYSIATFASVISAPHLLEQSKFASVTRSLIASTTFFSRLPCKWAGAAHCEFEPAGTEH